MYSKHKYQSILNPQTMLTDALLQQSFKVFPLASLLLKADAPNFTILDVNAALLAVSNIKSANLLIGKSIFEVFPDNPNDADANGVSKLKASLCKTVETGTVQDMPPQRYDIEVANTKRFIVKYWAVKNIPLFNEDGSVGAILHTTIDVTESILAQQNEAELLSKITTNVGFSGNLTISTAIGSWDLDIETQDFYWSPEFFDICGYAPNSFTPSLAKALEIIHPDDHKVVTEAFNNAIEKGESYRIEHRIITATNQVISVLATGIITKNKDGKNSRLTGFFQNITSQKQQDILLSKTLDVLVNSEKRYKQLFEENPSPMFIWDFKNLQIIDCNEEALLLYGYSREAFLQLTIKDIRPKDDHEEIETINQSEESYHKIGKRVWRHVKKDGSIIHVFIVGHLIDYNGTKASLVCLNDVSEKVIAEKKLQESETRYKSFFNNSLDANLLSIENGKILAANPVACNLFGYTEEVFCKLTRQDIADTTDKRLIELLKDKYETGHGEAIHRLLKKDGQIFEAFVSSTEYLDINGEKRNAVIIKDLDEKIKAENALKDSEAKYRSFFENGFDGNIISIEDGHIINVNHVACRMFGYSAEEFCQLSRKDITDQSDIRLHKLLKDKRETGHGESIIRAIKKNGEIFEANVCATSFIHTNGEERNVVTFKDITETLKAEQALKESEAKYRSLFENAMDATMFTSPDGQILEANPAACNMFQYTENELQSIGRDAIVDTTDPRLAYFLSERAKNGSARGQYRCMRKNGELFETETSSTVYTDKNGVKRAIVTTKDITETLKSEKALKESEARYRLFFENGNNANFLSKADGSIIVANQMASKLFGYSIAELCKMKRPQLADLSDPRVIKLIKDKETTGYATGIHRMLHKDRHTFEAFINSNIYYDANGEERHALTVKDLSEQQKAEQALKESESRYKSFFENGNNANFISTANGDIITANQMASSMLGYSITELCQMNSAQLCDLSDPRLIAMNIAKDAKGTIAGIHTILHKNGHAFDAYSHSNLYYDANGEERYAIVVKDLSEQQKAEQALKESESRYRLFFENGINANLITKRDGSIIVANQMASNMFGYSTEELCQMNRSQMADMIDPRLLKLIRDKEVHGNAAGIHRFFHKNGQAFDGFLRSNIYLDATGEERTAITIKDLSEQQKTEQALAESDRKYRLLFYQSPIPKWIYEIGTFKIIDVNEAAIEHYGYSREEFLNLTILDLRPAEEVHKLFATQQNSVTVTGLFKAGKFIHKKKNGRIITVDISSIAIDFDDKKCKLVIANDVTDVEYALKELAISNERYHYVTKATTDAIWDWDLENDKILLGDGFENTFGYPLTEKSAPVSFLLENIHPDDKQQMVDAFYRIVKSNEAQFRNEFRFKKADETYAYVVNKGVVIRNEYGRTIRIVGGMRDITTYKKELLRLQLLESVITNINDGVIITEAEITKDEQGRRIIYINEAFTNITGYTEDDIIGKNSNQLMGGKTDKTEVEKIKNAMSNWQSYKTDILSYKKNGEPFWANLSISPVIDDNDICTNWVAIQRDVTEQKLHVSEMIKAIIKTQEDERIEIGSELHDNICQILTSCKIAFKMLEKNIVTAEKVWFEQGIDQINLVFKEIRNLSHRLAPAFFKDSTLEESLSSLVRTFNIEDNYNIVLQFDDSFKTYASSREFQLNIYRILQEQLRNILKYADAENITISGITTSHSLKMMIQDDGIGFNPQTIKSGIGLANMKRRTELFGGKLSIESALGKGCTITVEVPLSEVQ